MARVRRHPRERGRRGHRRAAVAWVASLARPPAGSLGPYFGAHVEPRDATRSSSYDTFRDPLLLGGSNALLLAASFALGLPTSVARIPPLILTPRGSGLASEMPVQT